jgi:TonB-linked SusC/RagA family outer membrane protein
MKIYLQNHFDWCKIMKNTLSQIIMGLLFTGVSFAEKSNAQAVLNRTVSISLHDAQFTVAGTVTDSQGEPLVGVSIKLKGTGTGASTNAKGQYSLILPDGNGTLVFSYLGYATQEVSVNNRATINISLKEDARALDDVVVVGYGTQKRTNLTASVDVISGAQLANRPSTKVQDLIKGASPNLQITMDQHGGEPGAESSLNIRGMGSISGLATPLVLVDGVEMSIGNVDPETVESVSVLKDASASAIYGSRAPFGVILITTKKGKAGKINIQYSNNLSSNSPIRWASFDNSLIWATAMNQASANAGLTPAFPAEQMARIEGYLNGTFPYEYNPAAPIDNIFAGRRNGNANYDWPQIMMKDHSFSQKHNINLSGGDAKTTYFVSGGFTGQDGQMNYTTDKYNRYNFLTNISSQVTNWLNFSSSLKYANSSTDYPDGYTTVGRESLFVAFIQFAPFMPMYNINGSTQAPFVRLMQDSGRELAKTNDFLVSLASELEPVKGWKTKFSYNANLVALRKTDNPKPVLVELGTGAFGNIGKPSSSFITDYSNNSYKVYNVVSSYEKRFGQHYLNVLAGVEQEERIYSSTNASGTGLITTEVPSIHTSVGAKTADDQLYHFASQGIFGRLNYNFNEKYLFEFSGRYNGSSRFSKDTRWGFFPSASAGYTVSKENFWEPIKKYVNTFKLRASYGSLGNENILNPKTVGFNTAYYQYLTTIPVTTQINWILDGQRPAATGVPALLTPDLTWETITTLNLGANAEFLNNRLELGFDWYNRISKDMLGPSESLPTTLGQGSTTPPKNNAELSTKGFELVLKWKDRISSKFSYNAQLNIGDSRTTVLKYKNDIGDINGFYKGKNVGEIWGYETDGLMQTPEEGADAMNANLTAPRTYPSQVFINTKWGPGDMRYKDLNGDKTINSGLSTLSNHGDLSVIGNFIPRYNIGFMGGFEWKNVDFSMMWQGVGRQDYVPDRDALSFWGLGGAATSSGILKDSRSLDYWRPANETNILGPNTDAYFGKPYFNAETYKNRMPNSTGTLPQSRYVLNASYLRLKNLQIGYTVPQKYAKKLLFQRARIYASGENLLLLTTLPKNLDPETIIASTPGFNYAEKNNAYAFGGMIYPLSSSLSFGLNLTF